MTPLAVIRGLHWCKCGLPWRVINQEYHWHPTQDASSLVECNYIEFLVKFQPYYLLTNDKPPRLALNAKPNPHSELLATAAMMPAHLSPCLKRKVKNETIYVTDLGNVHAWFSSTVSAYDSHWALVWTEPLIQYVETSCAGTEVGTGSLCARTAICPLAAAQALVLSPKCECNL